MYPANPGSSAPEPVLGRVQKTCGSGHNPSLHKGPYNKPCILSRMKRGIAICQWLLILVGSLSALLAGNREPTPPPQGFVIQEDGNETWLVRPDGERFFSVGVCVVSQGMAREEFDRANPGY